MKNNSTVIWDAIYTIKDRKRAMLRILTESDSLRSIFTAALSDSILDYH